MDEQRSMSRQEMVVGSYVCPVGGDGPRGQVTRVELDERGPEYDLLHVSDADGPTRCQRAVMRLVDQPAPSVQYEDSPQGLVKRIADLEAALKSASDARDMATTLLHKRQHEYDQMYVAHEKAHEDLAREIANHEAADKYGRKAGDERDALRAQLDEAAGLEVEMERRDRVAREKYAELERDRDLVENAMREASARAQRNEDNLKAVLAREATLREAQTNLEATRSQLRKMTAARDTACVESASRLREIMTADARADVWQAAAQDALDQLAHCRKQAKEQTKLCDMTVDIDFRHTGTLATLAKIAPPRDKKGQL